MWDGQKHKINKKIKKIIKKEKKCYCKYAFKHMNLEKTLIFGAA